MSAGSLIDAHAEQWAQRLRELTDGLRVPGAALAVSHRGERFLAAAGVCGLRNPAPVTVDTAFQVGSISKLYTATLLMVIAGPQILDAPVADLVPEAHWMEGDIRVIHLLTHSSGLGGDVFADTGRGDDCLARYVSELAAQPRDVPGAPGRRYSYCNSGYAVLGRLIEVLSGSTYDTALRERVLEPLRATATTTLPEQTLLRPAALGHNGADEGPISADDEWNFARSCGPLGGICATPGDLLAFAELHLGDGAAADGGPRLLSADTAQLMRARHLPTPALCRPAARGLGFGIFDWPQATLYGHDGETLGQIAKLRLLPEQDFALVVLTNAIPDGDELTRALEAEVLGTLGLAAPRLPEPVAGAAVDPRPYEGIYRNCGGSAIVSGEDGGLRVIVRHDALSQQPSTETIHLAPIGEDAFVNAELAEPTRVIRFADPDPSHGGRFRSYFNGRIAWRSD